MVDTTDERKLPDNIRIDMKVCFTSDEMGADTTIALEGLHILPKLDMINLDDLRNNLPFPELWRPMTHDETEKYLKQQREEGSDG